MSQNEGRSGSSQRRLVEDDDGLDVAIAAPRRSTGDTPISRRASPLISPRLTRDPTSREGTPGRVSFESLSSRPRSNVRTRTPMRAESPLNANAFRRVSPEASSREGQRVSVRPLAGATVGAVLQTQRETEVIHYARRSFAVGSSTKQRPSHRKLRRWNNDNFVGIAFELAKSSSRGPAAAESLLMAQADAPKYRALYNPQDCPQSAMSKLSEDDKLAEVRDRFFNGEIGHGPAVQAPYCKKAVEDDDAKPDVMLSRIHGRLRGVVIRACCNSAPSVEIVDAFENFLVHCFVSGKTILLEWVDTLLETPTITKLTTGQTIVRFYFDSESSTGGFHRLLLHAVCQFHGLNAVSTTVGLNGKTKSRLLTVSGSSLSGPHVRLVDHASEEKVAEPQPTEEFVITSQMAALKV